MLRWYPRHQVATACLSFSPPELNFLDSYFIFMYMRYNHCHRATAHLQLNLLLLILLLLSSSLSLLSPLYRVFIHIFLRQTTSLWNTVFQLFCLYYLSLVLLWHYGTFTLALSEVCVQCPIWLFSVVPSRRGFLVCCLCIF